MQNILKSTGYATQLIGRCFDFWHALFLGLYALLVVGPLGFLRGPLMFERFFWYLRVFTPLGLLSRSVRVAIEWRLGHFDIAISQAEEVVDQVESYYKLKSESQVRMRVLGDLYTILTRAYMHAGHIDEAMRVVLRANKSMGAQRLAGLADLDAKTAHLVRAGLAAGRLLDGGGLATMFIKSETPRHNASEANDNDQKHTKTGESPLPSKQPQGAKIIPFPVID